MDQAARSNMPLLMQKGLLKTKFLPRQMHIENGKSVSGANRFCEHIANEVSENTVRKVHAENGKSVSEANRFCERVASKASENRDRDACRKRKICERSEQILEKGNFASEASKILDHGSE